MFASCKLFGVTLDFWCPAGRQVSASTAPCFSCADRRSVLFGDRSRSRSHRTSKSVDALTDGECSPTPVDTRLRARQARHAAGRPFAAHAQLMSSAAVPRAGSIVRVSSGRAASSGRRAQGARLEVRLPAASCIRACMRMSTGQPARPPPRLSGLADVLDGAPRAGATEDRGSRLEASSGRREAGAMRLTAACMGMCLHGSRVHAHVADHAQGERHSACVRA